MKKFGKKKNFTRNSTDCSKKADQNPTRLLQEASHRLKEISCLQVLKEEMTSIVAGSQISRRNLAKFFEARDRIDSLEKMQFYLYNFILAGSAMQTSFEK